MLARREDVAAGESIWLIETVYTPMRRPKSITFLNVPVRGGTSMSLVRSEYRVSAARTTLLSSYSGCIAFEVSIHEELMIR